MDTLENHNLTLTCCRYVNDICTDLFDYTGINYFNFVRVYNDQSRFSLCSSHEWADFFLKNYQNYKLIFEEKINHADTHCIIWDTVEGIREDSLMVIAREKFNIDHGVTLVSRYSEYTELCYFASDKFNYDINQLYINHIEVLHAFILYFKEKAADLIKQAECDKYKLMSHEVPWLRESVNNSKSSFEYKEFFEVCKIKKYYLGGEKVSLRRTSLLHANAF